MKDGMEGSSILENSLSIYFVFDSLALSRFPSDDRSVPLSVYGEKLGQPGRMDQFDEQG